MVPLHPEMEPSFAHRDGLAFRPTREMVFAMKTLARTTDDLLGTYRTFGEVGPVYQVLKKLSEDSVHIIVVETGEELDYPSGQALQDPEAD